MDTIEMILWIVLPLILVYIVIIAVLHMKAMGVMSKVGKENILLISANANFFGEESSGSIQIKGNGTLVLTKDKLYFELLVPKKIIEIPLEKIERIEEGRSHLGKTKVSKLLKIIYKNKSNSLDSAAWLVRDRKKWVSQIGELMK